MVCSVASSSADSSRPVNTTTGTSRSAASSRIRLEHLEPRHVGKLQVEHHAIDLILAQLRERLGAGLGGGDLDVLVAQQLGDALALGLVVLDQQQPLAARRWRSP